MQYIKSKTTLEVYTESQRRRQYVGKLEHNLETNQYIFTYDLAYLRSKTSIGIGVELPATRIQFFSEPGELFPTFLDRIPDKRNSAYPDYCAMQGISVDESNYIILLGTIGHRGPSSFVYEAVYDEVSSIIDDLKKFRSDLDLTQWDFAMLFDFPILTIQRIESGKSRDKNILRLISIFMTEADVALKQMQLSGKRVHRDVRERVFRYFMRKRSA